MKPTAPTPRTESEVYSLTDAEAEMITLGKGIKEIINADFARQLERENFSLQVNKELVERENVELKEQLKRDGKWIDKWGACKLCDGEIPHGHIDSCDLWKLEQELAKLREDKEKMIELLEACNKHVPANAYFGNIINKPYAEVCLKLKVRSAIDAAKKGKV